MLRHTAQSAMHVAGRRFVARRTVGGIGRCSGLRLASRTSVGKALSADGHAAISTSLHYGAAPSRGFASSSRTLSNARISHPSPTHEHSDAVILGGGVAGLALACSLAASPQVKSGKALTGGPLRMTLLEASDMGRLRSWAHQKQVIPRNDDGPVDHDGIEWENRVVSLTAENWMWLQGERTSD